MAGALTAAHAVKGEKMANSIHVEAGNLEDDDDGIAKGQTLAAAGDVDLDGDLVTDGVAVLTGAGYARQVEITSTGDDTGVIFTLYGFNATGNMQEERVTGTSAGVATSTLYFRTITRIAASGATDGDISVGVNEEGVTRIVNIDTALNPSQVSVTATAIGTINYTLQWTTGDIQGNPIWVDSTDMTGEAGDSFATIMYPATGMRIKLNSGDGEVAADFLQSGLGN